MRAKNTRLNFKNCVNMVAFMTNKLIRAEFALKRIGCLAYLYLKDFRCLRIESKRFEIRAMRNLGETVGLGLIVNFIITWFRFTNS